MDGRRYRGVSKRGKKWCAEIRDSSTTFPKGRRWLGTHDTPEHAAQAYDKEARKIRGPQAVTNFPGPSDQNQVNIDVPIMMPNADCESSCVLAKILSERDSWLQSTESHTAGVAEVKGVRINCDPFDPPEFTILSPSFSTRVGQYTYNSVEVINNHPIFEVGEVQYVPVLDSLRDDSAEHPLFQVPVLDSLRDGSVEHPLFPVTISPVAISKLIELPILLWEYPPAEVRTCGCPDHQNMFPPWDNIPATYLRIHLDQTSHHFGYVKLCTTEVLAVREDRKVLLPFHMEALCRFCQIKVVPLIEECRESSGLVQSAIDSIMQSITKSSFQNFFHSYCAELMDNYPYWKAPLSPYEV